MDIENKLLHVTPLIDTRIIDETLSRIGIANKRERILFPSCYLHQIDNSFYLAHFKQLFSLRNNGYDNISIDDIKRRNIIAFYLFTWKMIDVDQREIQERDKFVFILPHCYKHEWVIQNKFNVNSLNKE